MSPGRLPAALWILACGACAMGCRPQPADRIDALVTLRVRPSPPRVGPVTAVIEVRAPDGRPIPGLELKLEGNMSHAGMRPVFATAREAAPGRYEAQMELTMAGDWFLLIEGTGAEGRLEHRLPLPGVQPR